MTGLWWRLANLLSHSLEFHERDAVLGDLAESGPTGARAFCDVLSLVVRRQAALWKDWRPWVALVAVVGPAATMLCLNSFALWRSYDLYFWIGRNYRNIDTAILQETHISLLNGVVLMLRGSIVMACFAWTTGFVLGSLARRTIWIIGALFCLTMLFGGVHFGFAPRLMQALVVVPSLLGMHLGLRPPERPLTRGLLWAASIVTALVGHQSWLWWPIHSVERMQLFLLIRYWPLVYLVAAACWRRWSTGSRGLDRYGLSGLLGMIGLRTWV